ncbi:hypothetical protein TruAng_011149 [Truncatella angustata]|nr:hypothetical protein TruAng_011149 [Truncatella angustata]
MSQPPYDYPPYLGQPPQHPYQYAPRPHIQPASSFYTSPQEPSPAVVAGNHAAINGSFEYNGSRIPGLGMSVGSNTPLPPMPYRVESNPSHPQAPYRGRSSPGAPRRQDQTMAGLGKATKFVAQPSAPTAVLVRSNEPSEEGEFSEAQFEDLYEPRSVVVGLGDGPKQQSTAGPKEDSAGSADDADGSSIYDTGSAREEMVIDSTSASQPAVDEDDDYEPVASEVNGYAQAPQSFSSFTARDGASKQATERTTKQNGEVPLTTTQSAQPAQSPDHNQSANVSSLPYKSVTEAKKKAQEAILGLWPLKVRYQNYLDEGLDPRIVKSLFTDLGLDTSAPKPAVALSRPSAPETSIHAEKQPEAQASPQSTSQPASTSASSKLVPDKSTSISDSKTQAKKSAQEERKDKIARMLAEKKKKNAAQPASTAEVSVTSKPLVPAITPTGSEPSDAAKVKLRAQNNQKILEKLAALKKQQVKKTNSAEQPAPATAAESSKTQDSAAILGAPSTKQATVPSTSLDADVSSTPGGPAGLSVSSSPRSTPKPRNVKRPVASDFDGYPLNGNTFKRTRTQETLIIDVSDDEDVEMDLGSPTEPPGAAMPNNTLTRQNSLGAFPPLTHARSWRSQKSSPATPAVATPSEHGQKLDLLTLQIQEARRKIAEAEAKKAALKKPNELTTPLAQSPARTPVPPESSTLSKPSDSVKASKVERCDPIASYQLPIIDAALREKQDRLEQLRAEAVRLDLEIQAKLSERQQLAIEMEDLEIARPQAPEAGTLEKAASEETSNEILAVPTTHGHAAAGVNLHQPDPVVPKSNTTNPEMSIPEVANQVEHAQAMDEATESSPENTNMDIDSDSDSSSVTDASDNVATAIQEAIVQTEPPSNTRVEFDMPQTEASTRTDSLSSPQSTNGEGSGSNNDSAVETGNAGGDPVPVDVDVPMQISDAEDEDSYEPAPMQISDHDPAHVAREGEVQLEPHVWRTVLTYKQVADEEPYEPSPAQLVQPASHAEPRPRAAEVQLRSVEEPHLLTNIQAIPPSTLSASDLLSYESPLRYFHAYKFHPQYMESVPGGLKSMTYSSRIDATRPICPFLIDGGECPNGPGCEFQHFDTMMRSDSDIIQELGSTDLYTGEQKDQFIDGLKKVLANLKRKKLKDFDSISRALVQYRSDFLGDKSKVLPLKDVVI